MDDLQPPATKKSTMPSLSKSTKLVETSPSEHVPEHPAHVEPKRLNPGSEAAFAVPRNSGASFVPVFRKKYNVALLPPEGANIDVAITKSGSPSLSTSAQVGYLRPLLSKISFERFIALTELLRRPVGRIEDG